MEHNRDDEWTENPIFQIIGVGWTVSKGSPRDIESFREIITADRDIERLSVSELTLLCRGFGLSIPNMDEMTEVESTCWKLWHAVGESRRGLAARALLVTTINHGPLADCNDRWQLGNPWVPFDSPEIPRRIIRRADNWKPRTLDPRGNPW